MFCSVCGHALVPGEAVCAQCGRPVAGAVPPIPNFGFQLQTYASRVRALSIVWFVYGGLSLVLGIVGLTFASSFMNGGFGPWAHGGLPPGPWGPEWFMPAILRFGWAVVIVRSALALVVGWGLMERTRWGRIAAIAAAFLCLFKIPIGTALGIWTLVTLLGYRNTTLYEQL